MQTKVSKWFQTIYLPKFRASKNKMSNWGVKWWNIVAEPCRLQLREAQQKCNDWELKQQQQEREMNTLRQDLQALRDSSNTQQEQYQKLRESKEALELELAALRSRTSSGDVEKLHGELNATKEVRVAFVSTSNLPGIETEYKRNYWTETPIGNDNSWQ